MNDQKGMIQSDILIVDDNVTNLKILLAALKKSNHRVSVAKDGETAIKQIQSSAPGLVLLDVMMPGIDGFETCRRLKEDKATKDIPIIFMTALSDPVDEVYGFELGAVDYITKPFNLDKTIARVNTHLTVQRQKQELFDLNATKDRLFSIIAHDLKNPFSNLKSMVNLMTVHGDRFSPTELRDFALQLKASTDNAYKLLENLLEWAQLQQQHVEVRPVVTNLLPLVSVNVDLYLQEADRKGVQFHNRVPQNTKVFADIGMIKTVIRNLINNAIKFTNAGDEVVISCQDLDDRFVEVVVADTGVGIKEGSRKKLFRIDQKVNTEGTDGEKGTGLGLVLCKEFIERNGGSISVESAVDGGSTFRFSLLQPPSAVSPSTQQRDRVSG